MHKVVSIVLNPFTHDSRVLKECLSLQKAGYEVKVVAMHEKGLPESEMVEGIPVTRISLRSRNWSKNRLVQLFKFLEFSWKTASRFAKKAHVFHCNDVAPLPIAVLSRWFFNRRLKILYDAHELEFDKAESGSNYYPQWALAFAERLFIKKADAVVTVSPLIANAYVERYQIPEPKVVMNCPNYAPPSNEKLLRNALGINDSQKLFLYQGGLIPKRGVELLLDIFESLSDDYQLVFLGFGPLTDLVKNAAQANTNIHFHDAVSPTELHRYTSDADVGFCIYQGRTGNHQLTIGNKIFQYIMAGVPVLASDLQGLHYVLQDPVLGKIVTDFRDPDAVKESILELAQTNKENRKTSFDKAAKIYTWEAQEEILLSVYQEICPA